MTLLRRTREIEKLCEEIELLLRGLKLPDRAVLALADAAMGYRVRNATYRAAADVTQPIAGRDLLALARAGLLEAKGEKRGRHYVATPKILEIRQRVVESKSIPDPFVLVDESLPKQGDDALRLPGMEDPS